MDRATRRRWPWRNPAMLLQSLLRKHNSMRACLVLAGIALLVFASPRTVIADGNTRPITTRDLATLRDIDGVSISPDRRWAVFSTTQAEPDHNRYDVAWHVLDMATGRTRRVGGGGELLPSGGMGMISQYIAPSVSAWSPDSLWVAYLRRDKGRTQVWHVRRDGTNARQLTYGESDVRALAYARNGRTILFQTEPTQAQIAADLLPEGRIGFRYDERFIPLYSVLPVAPRDVDSERLFAPTPSQLTSRQVWALELSSGQVRVATEAERAEYGALTTPAPAHSGARVGRSAASSDGGIAWTEARDPERQGAYPPQTIVAQPLGASSPIACVAPTCTGDFIAGLWWRNEDELLFIRQQGLRQPERALYAWRPGHAHPPRLILSNMQSHSGCAVVQDTLLCLYSEPDHPRRLVAINLDTGAIDTLFEPNPDFARFDLGTPPRSLAIRAASGAENRGYLVLPPNHREGERLPLVVVTYDCSGFLRGGVGDEYPIYPLAAQGMAVLCFNAPEDLNRLARMDSVSYEKWDRGPGNPARRRIEETLDEAISKLDQLGVIDPDRVGVTGLSYGAEIVYTAMPHMPRLAAAIASSGGPGPSQYPYLGRLDRNWRRAFGLGPPEQTPARWLESSFSPHVKKVRAPLLINVSDHEFVGSLDSVTALEDAGRSVEMYVFPDEYHVKSQPAHRLAIYNRNIDWMNFWLQGREDPVREKAEQYKRWRAMRAKQCELFQGTDAPWYCREEALPN
jgi:dipeptidyl aminopeptidase/acylaminoacyl peptidase